MGDSMNKLSSEKSSNASNIGYGLLVMILAVTIFFYTSAAIGMLIMFFSVILILSGMARIFNAFSNEELSNIGVVVKFISGIIIIVMSVFIMISLLADPAFSVAIVIFVYSITLLIIGIARLIIGLGGAKYVKWYRILLMIIGVVVIILSAIVLFAPDLSYATVFTMFSISILLSGFARFLLGFAGKEKLKA